MLTCLLMVASKGAKFLLDIALMTLTKTFADAVYSGQQAGYYGALMQGRTQGETWALTLSNTGTVLTKG